MDRCKRMHGVQQMNLLQQWEVYLHQQYKAKGIVPFPYVMLAACKTH